MLGSPDRAQRGPPASDPARLLRVLSRGPNPLVARPQCAAPPKGRAAEPGPRHRDPPGRWTASPVHAGGLRRRHLRRPRIRDTRKLRADPAETSDSEPFATGLRAARSSLVDSPSSPATAPTGPDDVVGMDRGGLFVRSSARLTFRRPRAAATDCSNTLTPPIGTIPVTFSCANPTAPRKLLMTRGLCATGRVKRRGGSSSAPVFRRSRANRPAAHKPKDANGLHAHRSSTSTTAHESGARKSLSRRAQNVHKTTWCRCASASRQTIRQREDGCPYRKLVSPHALLSPYGRSIGDTSGQYGTLEDTRGQGIQAYSAPEFAPSGSRAASLKAGIRPLHVGCGGPA